MDLEQSKWLEKAKKDTNAVILDVRTTDEVAEGFIPNAINIDFYGGAEFLEAVNKLDADKNYYIYCRSGGRSSQACMILDQLGFKNTFNLVGGMNDWTGEVITK